MKFRFSIGRRIGTGFGVLIVLTLVAFLLTNLTLKTGREKTNEVTRIYTPSVNLLKDLNLLIVKSKMLISNWVYYPSPDDIPEKKELRIILGTKYPKLQDSIHIYETEWKNVNTKKDLDSVFIQIDSLFSQDKIIMNQLNSFTSYDDPASLFIVRPMVDAEGIITTESQAILDKLGKIIDTEQETATRASSDMLHSFSLLDRIVKLLGAALLAGGIIIAFFTVRSIVRPVTELKDMLLSMGKGVLPTSKSRERGDEIGEMAGAMNKLVESLHSTTDFANEVGKGNFESHYEPLSNEDMLGHALLKMRKDLYENEQVLERKVIERTEEVVRQKQEIEVKNRELEVLYKHVTDSIRYAKRIQESILPPDTVIKKLLPQSFVFFKPKDIVSGDFYWISEKNDSVVFSAVDCTGHGVPGAFMSLVGYNLLKEIIEGMPELNAAKILDQLSMGVRSTLHQFDKSAAKDGMDIALCIINRKTMEMQYAGAFNPAFVIRKNTLQEIKADKILIGYSYNEGEVKNYTNNTFKLEKDDQIYVSTDGYPDQFGGQNGKKFMIKNFRNLLLDIHNLGMAEQKAELERRFDEWKGNLEQIDDICVIGVKA